MLGTQSLPLRLSSQNRLSFSRAGSFHVSSLGFCRGESGVSGAGMPRGRVGAGRRAGGPTTHRDEDAMQVPRRARLGPVAARAHDRRQALHVAHAHDVDVVLAAEGLDQREVDLQRDVALVVLVGGQHAKGHVVRVPAGVEGMDGEWPESHNTGASPTAVSPHMCTHMHTPGPRG